MLDEGSFFELCGLYDRNSFIFVTEFGTKLSNIGHLLIFWLILLIISLYPPCRLWHGFHCFDVASLQNGVMLSVILSLQKILLTSSFSSVILFFLLFIYIVIKTCHLLTCWCYDMPAYQKWCSHCLLYQKIVFMSSLSSYFFTFVLCAVIKYGHLQTHWHCIMSALLQCCKIWSSCSLLHWYYIHKKMEFMLSFATVVLFFYFCLLHCHQK